METSQELKYFKYYKFYVSGCFIEFKETQKNQSILCLNKDSCHVNVT